jgi:hypothetical protein
VTLRSIQSRQTIRVTAVTALDLLHPSAQTAHELKRPGLVFVLDDHLHLDEILGRENDGDVLRFGQIEIHNGSLLT